jgi:hypothetical protein
MPGRRLVDAGLLDHGLVIEEADFGRLQHLRGNLGQHRVQGPLSQRFMALPVEEAVVEAPPFGVETVSADRAPVDQGLL